MPTAPAQHKTMKPSEEALIGQRLVRLTRADKAVAVREMKWRDALAFIDLLSKSLGKVLTVSEEGKVVFDVDKLPALVTESTVLTDYLLTKSVDLKPEEVGDLAAADALELLSVAIELNLNDDLLGKVKGIAAKVGAMFAPARAT